MNLFFFPSLLSSLSFSLSRYKDILVGMSSSVLEKIQLHFNMDELREVDDETVDDVRLHDSHVIIM